MSICFNRRLATTLLNTARLAPDDSVHGCITLRDNQPYAAYPIGDISAESAEKFSNISSKLQDGESIFAIYESHPHSPAQPSAEDIAYAPELVHCYISLNTKGVLEMRAFKLNGKSPEEISIHIS